MKHEPGEATQLLARVIEGDRLSVDRLLEIVYPDLLERAQKLMRCEKSGHTMQATALVHESYLRLIDQSRIDWRGRTHFFAVAASTMRRLLVDHARAKAAEKRGGDRRRVMLENAAGLTSDGSPLDALCFEEALTKLAEFGARQARVVELRFFAGLSVEETAEALGVSRRTVEGDWTMAKAWLRRELSAEDVP